MAGRKFADGAIAARKLALRRESAHFHGAFQAMGSPCELLVDTDSEVLAKRLLEITAAEAWRIEQKFSRYLPDNIVAKINRSSGQPVTVDDETARMLDFAETLYQLSDRLFDITSGVLGKVWTFDGSDRVPSAADVDSVMGKVGWHRVSWQRPDIRLRPGMQIDLGGIGKEYAADRAAAMLSEDASCGCLVNFGGDIAVVGETRSGRGWQVGIEAPGSDSTRPQKLVRLQAGALATSGDSRRFLLRDGKRYGHILNPLTGWPLDGVPRSVTVAAGTCTQAGMLTTLAMLRGGEAETFLEQQGVQFWCLR